ncbi:MAG: glycosyl hydrolase family 28 protein [Firmicutes bacterium]|nr:glycosyl hydrolase family 28 protein [Bacillota bacterium]
MIGFKTVCILSVFLIFSAILGFGYISTADDSFVYNETVVWSDGFEGEAAGWSLNKGNTINSCELSTQIAHLNSANSIKMVQLGTNSTTATRHNSTIPISEKDGIINTGDIIKIGAWLYIDGDASAWNTGYPRLDIFPNGTFARYMAYVTVRGDGVYHYLGGGRTPNNTTDMGLDIGTGATSGDGAASVKNAVVTVPAGGVAGQWILVETEYFCVPPSTEVAIGNTQPLTGLNIQLKLQQPMVGTVYWDNVFITKRSLQDENSIKSIDISLYPYNADTTGTEPATSKIQQAIDDISIQGGEIFFAEGVYRTATINLKSNVTLNISEKALVQASRTQDDWHSKTEPIIKADGVFNVGIKGSGVIDGAQSTYRYDDGVTWPRDTYISGNRPHFILLFRNCINVNVCEITLQNSCDWVQHYDNCDYVTVKHVTVRNPVHRVAEFTDGIDINGCRNVLLDGLDIETGDDAICIKNINMRNKTVERQPSYNIVVKNCIVASTCNATKIGTQTYGDIYDVTFENIVVNKHTSTDSRNRACVAAIVVQSIDHNKVHNITFKNYTVNDCDTPLFICVMNRTSYIPEGDIGSVSNVLFKNITVHRSARTSQFNTELGGYIRNITLENIEIHNYGDSKQGTVERPAYNKYPDANIFGQMPSYGLYAIDTIGLVLKGENKFYDVGGSDRPLFDISPYYAYVNLNETIPDKQITANIDFYYNEPANKNILIAFGLYKGNMLKEIQTMSAPFQQGESRNFSPVLNSKISLSLLTPKLFIWGLENMRPLYKTISNE